MEKLVKQAQRGDKAAFLELIEGNKLSLSRAAMAIVHNEEDAADAVSETVLTVFQKLCTLREPKYFKSWMMRILIYHCYDILRRRKRSVSWETLPEENREEIWEDRGRDEVLDIRFSLSALAENDRLVLTLYYLDDLSVRDISKLLGVTENAVKSRLMRGRSRFLRIYEEREAESCEAYERG